MTVTAVAVVGPAHRLGCTQAGGGVSEPLYGPPTGQARGAPAGLSPLRPPSSAPFLQRNLLRPELKGGPLPSCAPARPLPQNASILPRPPKSHAPSYHFLALGASVRLPRHGAGSPSPPRHRPTQRPLLTRLNPTTAPPPSGLTSTDTPRLRGPPRGTTGLVVRPTRVTAPLSRICRTTTPNSPSGSTAPLVQLDYNSQRTPRAANLQSPSSPGLHTS